jgi:hypothetical protein
MLQRGSVRLFLLTTGMGSTPFGDKGLVGELVVLAFQMDIGFHGGNDTGVAQPLLNEFPIHRLVGAEVGTDQVGRVRMAELMGMQPDARPLTVVLKHTLHRGSSKGQSTGVLSFSIPSMFVEHDPQMIGARRNVNPGTASPL